MACLKPLLAVRFFPQSYDSKSVVKIFGNVDVDILRLESRYGVDNVITLPCGSCEGCKADRSSEWSTRCMLESYSYEKNCFITLTYSDTDCPDSLKKEDLQKFFKRLRKYLDCIHVRYFACGEYGCQTHRPHYHAIIFGYFPEDAKAIGNTSKKNCYFTSKSLEKLWSHGAVIVGQVDYASCKYVAGYVDKKLELDNANGRTKPFIVMSNRPGIGYRYFSEHCGAIYQNDNIVLKNGQVVAPPRYCDKVADQLWYDLDIVKAQRKTRNRLNQNDLMQKHGYRHREELQLANSTIMKDKLKRRQRGL